jgi:hypothetical protein
VSNPRNDASGKERVSLSLDAAVIPLGRALASEDRRSLSNLIEILIVQEHERRAPERKSERGQGVAA